MNKCTQIKDSNNIFPEMPITLFAFIHELFLKLFESGNKDVYFLAREGQPLMRLFERYINHLPPEKKTSINAHYLEVSRRSTLLPSLNSLNLESFETLFRQYRNISLFEFLASLTLESFFLELCDNLNIASQEGKNRIQNFPESSLFKQLIALNSFAEIYESERQSRRKAFISYLTQLSGGVLPTELVVVDVGWKGTIQDNLFFMLCTHGDTSVQAVHGYYLGLVAFGAANNRNTKCGLLFSNTNGVSPGFHVFNENRALFEVLLAADHGSVINYLTDADGISAAVIGEFEEAEMLKRMVLPVQSHLFALFDNLLEITPPEFLDSRQLLKNALNAHARMVFEATQEELDWFSSLFHVENFGVFENSYFLFDDLRPSFIQKLNFFFELVRKRERLALGFWPWNTIRERGGIGLATLYRVYRLLHK